MIGPEGIQQQIDGEGVFQQHIAQQAGLRFSTEDETGVIRVGPNLLSVSQFPPYPSWQGYLPVIRKAFGTFREIAEPKGIQRIGLRYINQVMLGEESIDLEQFFDFYPFAGERMPQDYLSFIIGVQIAFHDDRDILRLQMTTGAKDESDRVPILLDLDYFPRISGEVSFENVFDWLDEAHMHIEEVFEGCLKDTLRDRFEEVRD